MTLGLLLVAIAAGGGAFFLLWQRVQTLEGTIERLRRQAAVSRVRAPLATPSDVVGAASAPPAKSAPANSGPAKRPYISVVPKAPTREEQIAKDLPIVVAAVAAYMADVKPVIRVYAPAQNPGLWGMVSRFDHRRSHRVSWDRSLAVAGASETRRQWYKFWSKA
jgi:hypothetical protein